MKPLNKVKLGHLNLESCLVNFRTETNERKYS